MQIDGSYGISHGEQRIDIFLKRPTDKFEFLPQPVAGCFGLRTYMECYLKKKTNVMRQNKKTQLKFDSSRKYKYSMISKLKEEGKWKKNHQFLAIYREHIHYFFLRFISFNLMSKLKKSNKKKGF